MPYDSSFRFTAQDCISREDPRTRRMADLRSSNASLRPRAAWPTGGQPISDAFKPTAPRVPYSRTAVFLFETPGRSCEGILAVQGEGGDVARHPQRRSPAGRPCMKCFHRPAISSALGLGDKVALCGWLVFSAAGLAGLFASGMFQKHNMMHPSAWSSSWLSQLLPFLAFYFSESPDDIVVPGGGTG